MKSQYRLLYLRRTGSWVPVAHACNLSTQEAEGDFSSRPDQANSSQEPISKKPITKKAGGVAQGIGPEFKL
jgi:hypothetical protein